jgi:minor histocompatibility antigen H13
MNSTFDFQQLLEPETWSKWGLKMWDERELILMYVHLLASALFPIYIGSHASLRRPPSAASPKKSEKDDDEEDELEVEPTVEGLRPSDAIMFPVLAGVTLAGLYYLIKWLNDPAILNKILGYYFSLLGVFGVGRLAADCLNVGTTFIFPSVWSSRGTAYYIDPLLSQQVTGEVKPARTQTHRKFTDKNNPLPGIFSSITFPDSINKQLWSLRALLNNHWVFRGYLHGVFSLKTKVQINDVFGFLLGITAIVLYNTVGKTWWLTNLIGFGFCYGTLQLMSPTTFWTGSLVLAGLFIYDITMVFYTPLMVTVATSLDVPIKLVFPGPKRGSMLGLGDVVLPGIMMALALRFDLYLHYFAKQSGKYRRDSTEPSTMTKAPYVEASGNWGERFWTIAAKDADAKTVADGSRFSKVYFKASLVGYVFGMLTTLVVLNIFNHAQPALLYLVPGVLISLWGTALARGEFALMWEYTEDGSLSDDARGNEKDQKDRDAKKEKKGNAEEKDGGSGDTLKPSSTASVKKNEHAQHVFLFSLSTPKPPASEPKKAILFEKS